ncbi:MAG: glycosyltransferase family 2 protein [Sedimentisphaerales bacterium]|nr:glycosyltransferase family 2 protein [Sedimentisphaerales bacterium]
MAIDLSVIIVNWNTRDLLGQCLSSLVQRSNEVQIEIIVVDNGSDDGSGDYVAASFPHVRLIRNRDNRGFAVANNQGMIAATGRNILFLNSDTVVNQGALKAMVEFLDSTLDAGACSCRLSGEDGKLQRNVRRFPTFSAMLYRYTVLKYFGLFKSARAAYRTRDFSYDEVATVDEVTGAVLAVKRSVLERVGGMDENLKLYFEETDLCRRMQQVAVKTYFIPQGVVTHLGGGSCRRLPSYRIEAMFFKSLFYYFRKHEGRGRTFLFSCVFKPGLYLYMLCETLLNLGSAGLSRLLRLGNGRVLRQYERSRHAFLFLVKCGFGVLFY